MLERERMREREAEAPPVDVYDELVKWRQGFEDTAKHGKKVVKGKGKPWRADREGSRSKNYTHPTQTQDVCLQHNFHFISEISTYNMGHCHQGGCGLFIIQGKGYTVVNGVRYDWKEGDLVLLPVLVGGVWHQHFNTDPSQASRFWLMRCWPLLNLVGENIKPLEKNPQIWEKWSEYKKPLPAGELKQSWD